MSFFEWPEPAYFFKASFHIFCGYYACRCIYEGFKLVVGVKI